ncbi:MAG TPA: glycosyltransferase [Actinomycetota bacterium]|nr:glycosyltransferase [Actinomycetota bacterium]
MVTRYLRGGSEQRVRDMMAALPEAEHHVLVGAGSELDLARRDLAGARVTAVPSLIRDLHPVRDVFATLAIAAAIRRVDADLVVTHQSKGGVVGRVAAFATARPVVHSLSMASFGDGYGRLEDRVFRWVERRLAPLTSRFVASGEDLRRRFVAIGVPAGKVRVVRSGVRLPEPLAVEIRATEPTLLYLGSLDERKNVLALIPFLRRVVELSSTRPRLRIAGEGPLRDALERGFRAAGLEADVELLGYVRDPDALIRSASCMVLLSRVEGLPQVLVQAAAVGTPFVSSDVDGARELVAMGARGTVVPLGDHEAAARAVAGILNDPRRAEPIETSAWRTERILRDHRTVLIESLGGAHHIPQEAPA